MNFRRLVYLVTDDGKRCRNYLLHRINIGRFFCEGDVFNDPPALEEGRLPAVAIKFDRTPLLNFFLMGGSHGRRDEKVVAVDRIGRTTLYDPKQRSVRALNSFCKQKVAPISLTDGRNLYVICKLLTRPTWTDHGLDTIIRTGDGGDWFIRSLPEPPYPHDFHPDPDPDRLPVLRSYAVVGDDSDEDVDGGARLWFSVDSFGTSCFDIGSCTWSKLGDWVLPFYGHGEQVLDQGLWFGLTSDGHDKDSVDMCATDLRVTPPTACIVWTDDQRPSSWPHWSSVWSRLVYLGRSRFCYARFFHVWYSDDHILRHAVVLTALEVKRCGEELAVVKHRSVQYNLDRNGAKCVL